MEDTIRIEVFVTTLFGNQIAHAGDHVTLSKERGRTLIQRGHARLVPPEEEYEIEVQEAVAYEKALKEREAYQKAVKELNEPEQAVRKRKPRKTRKAKVEDVEGEWD